MRTPARSSDSTPTSARELSTIPPSRAIWQRSSPRGARPRWPARSSPPYVCGPSFSVRPRQSDPPPIVCSQAFAARAEVAAEARLPVSPGRKPMPRTRSQPATIARSPAFEMPRSSLSPATQCYALCAWAVLRDGRPRCSTRRVFVRIHAPHVGFAGPAAIGNVVHRALARAGIDPPFKGSHHRLVSRHVSPPRRRDPGRPRNQASDRQFLLALQAYNSLSTSRTLKRYGQWRASRSAISMTM